MGDVGLARYEPALLPPCPTIRVLSYSNCQRSELTIGNEDIVSMSPSQASMITDNTSLTSMDSAKVNKHTHTYQEEKY